METVPEAQGEAKATNLRKMLHIPAAFVRKAQLK